MTSTSARWWSGVSTCAEEANAAASRAARLFSILGWNGFPPPPADRPELSSLSLSLSLCFDMERPPMSFGNPDRLVSTAWLDLRCRSMAKRYTRSRWNNVARRGHPESSRRALVVEPSKRRGAENLGERRDQIA